MNKEKSLDCGTRARRLRDGQAKAITRSKSVVSWGREHETLARRPRLPRSDDRVGANGQNLMWIRLELEA